MILAGGEINRLYKLTHGDEKTLLQFRRRYHLIDFVLKHFIISDLYQVKIFTKITIIY